MSRPLRIAYAMINCNRRDGSARAVNEVADLIRVDVTPLHGLPWPALLSFTSYYALAKVTISRRRFDIVHSIGINAMAANVITIQNIQPAKSKASSQQLEHSRISIAIQCPRSRC